MPGDCSSSINHRLKKIFYRFAHRPVCWRQLLNCVPSPAHTASQASTLSRAQNSLPALNLFLCVCLLWLWMASLTTQYTKSVGISLDLPPSANPPKWSLQFATSSPFAPPPFANCWTPQSSCSCHLLMSLPLHTQPPLHTMSSSSPLALLSFETATASVPHKDISYPPKMVYNVPMLCIHIVIEIFAINFLFPNQPLISQGTEATCPSSEVFQILINFLLHHSLWLMFVIAVCFVLFRWMNKPSLNIIHCPHCGFPCHLTHCVLLHSNIGALRKAALIPSPLSFFISPLTINLIAK